MPSNLFKRKKSKGTLPKSQSLVRPHRVDPLSRKRAWVLARRFAFCAAALSLFVYWLHPPLFERLDIRGRDLVFQVRASLPPPGEVVIVAVDEKSVKQYGRWPWPRAIQARLIERIKEMGAKVVALDIVYPSLQSPEQDGALVNALDAPGTPVVGGYFFRSEQTIETPAAAIKRFMANRISLVLEKPGALHDSVAAYPFLEGNHSLIAPHFDEVGFFNSIPDHDGLVRAAPMVLRFRGGYYPSLPLQALALAFNEPVALEISAAGVAGVRLGSRSLPVNELGRMALNFYNGEQRIRRFSAADVLSGALAEDALRGRLVFVGITEVGIADVRPTPTDHSFPGIAIHATVAANVIQGYHLYHNGWTVFLEVILMALLPLAMLWLMSFFDRPLYMVSIFALTIGLVWVIFYRAVTGYGMLISFFYPAIALSLSYSTFELYEILITKRKSRYLRRAFSSYVSPALVGRLINDPDALAINGERRNVTILFSDIRGFTSISEAMEPEQLVQLLNRFLGPMTEVLMREHGTLDKYIGDAIMAIYNAPLEVADHPVRSAVTAIKMQRLLYWLNRSFADEFGKTLKIGIGLNTGDAVIGNMGSARRFNYTAMGDTVNLASRLESRTKYYGVDIIAAKSTIDHLGPEFIVRRLDRIRVKGKNLPVDIFQLFVHGRDARTRKMTANFHAGLDHYLAGRFAEALAIFTAIQEEMPADRPTSIYVERSRYHLEHPPAGEWDGVFTATDK